MKAKLMLGSISFLKPEMKHLEKRIKHHASQLRFWELMHDLPFYRVEIFWEDSTRAALGTTLDLHAIRVNEPSPPGKSRNYLLKELYASDYDYLVCCDDDQVLEPGDESYAFLQALSPDLAAQGALITFQNETWITKAQERKVQEMQAWSYQNHKHVLKRAVCTGNMQVSCIPNLVKYGYRPLFFDEETMAQENEIPEDAKFQVDWLVAKHPIYHCATLYNKALDNYVQSSIYKSGRFRYMTNKGRIATLNRYIRERVPNRPEICDLDTLSKRRNTAQEQVYVDVHQVLEPSPDSVGFYIRKLSRLSDECGSLLLELMDRLNTTSLMHVTLEQAKEFYEEVCKRCVQK